jgi:5-methylcytosine-specific restriction protein A
MSWGLQVGRVYNRRPDVHGQYGGQQQGGIITPKDHPVIFMITGEVGMAHGLRTESRLT